MILEIVMSHTKKPIFSQKRAHFFFDRIFYGRRIFYEVEKLFLQLEYTQKYEIFF